MNIISGRKKYFILLFESLSIPDDISINKCALHQKLLCCLRVILCYKGTRISQFSVYTHVVVVVENKQLVHYFNFILTNNVNFHINI